MEKSPKSSEERKNQTEELIMEPSSEEIAVDAAEQVDIEDDLEEGEKAASPEWVHKFLERYWREKKEQAPTLAERQAEHIKTLNLQFIDRRKTIKAEGGEMSEKEFLFWEGDYADEWAHMQEHLRDGELYSMEEEADVEYQMFFTQSESTLHETIEAQAGVYYRDRAKALRHAIEAGDDPHKAEEMELLTGFYLAVNKHLDYKYMTPEDIRYDYDGRWSDYDRDRTFAHNNAITHLNRMNDLARKYGTTPFTPRQFWTSNKKDQTPAISRRMRYDRDVVEEYYAIAFSEEVAKRDRKLQRDMRGY